MLKFRYVNPILELGKNSFINQSFESKSEKYVIVDVKNNNTLSIKYPDGHIADRSLNYFLDNYYEFDYQKINVKRLTIRNTKKFKEKFKLEKLKDSIVIYKKGKLISANNIDSIDSLNEILKYNKVIPTVIENPEKEKQLISDTLNSNEDTLVYISFVNNELINEKSNNLKSLCDEYKIKYQFIRGYVFSEKQIISYMSQFNYSTIKNELIVVLENGSIKKIVEFDNLYYDDYIEIFKNYDIINSITDYLNYVDLITFNEAITKDEKNIFVFGDSKCKYCESVKYTLGSLAKENNLKIYYIDLQTEDNLNNSLKLLNYEGTYTYPLTIIIENKKIIDYVIGDSEKDYFVNVFTKNGIIR